MIDIIRTREQLATLVNTGAGYLYNDFGGSDPKNCPVHSVACRWVRTMLDVRPGPLGVKKLWSASLEELVAHLLERGKAFQFCGSEPELAAMARQGGGPAARPAPASRPEAVRANTAAPAPDADGSYRIEAEGDSHGPVNCWSAARLPFEPKGRLRVMRDAIRDRVRELRAGRDEVIEGVYTSPVLEEVDTENVLFYNVGLGSFAASAGRGLRFERRYANCPPAPGDAPGRALHHVAYRIAPQAQGFRYWRAGVPLASWDRVPCPPLHEFASATAIWLDMKRHGWEAQGPALAPHAPFALRLRITTGAGGASHAAVMVKPLLDAVVSALHVHDGRDLTELAGRLAEATAAEPAELERHLTDRSRAVLGVRRLLWAWRESVQWNPADSLCVAAEVLLEPRSDTAGGWAHSGELLPVSEA